MMNVSASVDPAAVGGLELLSGQSRVQGKLYQNCPGGQLITLLASF
jgi:hypothetical protein